MSEEHGKSIKPCSQASVAGAETNPLTLGQPGSNEADVVRRQLLAEVGDGEEAPGELDTLLDRAYLADNFFEEHVLQDPACLRSPELFREAWIVAQALADFYQKVGRAVASDLNAGAANAVAGTDR